MTVVAILRQLWSRRLLVAVGFGLAMLLAVLMAFKVGVGMPPTFDSRQYKVGIASAGVLIDSPSSQAVDLGSTESKADVTSLSARARLLANLMATSPLKDQIARRAGIASDRMIALPPADGPASKPSALATGATTVQATDPDANVLSVYVNEVLPIITADAQAPDPAIAARISAAAVVELELYLTSVAAADRVPDARKLVIKKLGPAKSATVQRGPRKLFAIALFVVVLGLWCVGVVVIPGLARGWREASEAEQLGADAPRGAAESMAAYEADRAPESAQTMDRPVRDAAARTDLPDLEHPERPMRVA